MSLIDKMFPDMVARRKEGKCATCGKDPNEKGFRNEISRKEFKVSGMCQQCQDDTFGPD